MAANPALAVILTAAWLSASLLFGGIEGVFLGPSAKLLTNGDRAVSIGIGAITIGLSVAALAYPMLAILTVVLLISIGLFILGVGPV